MMYDNIITSIDIIGIDTNGFIIKTLTPNLISIIKASIWAKYKPNIFLLICIIARSCFGVKVIFELTSLKNKNIAKDTKRVLGKTYPSSIGVASFRYIDITDVPIIVKSRDKIPSRYNLLFVFTFILWFAK